MLAAWLLVWQPCYCRYPRVSFVFHDLHAVQAAWQAGAVCAVAWALQVCGKALRDAGMGIVTPCIWSDSGCGMQCGRSSVLAVLS